MKLVVALVIVIGATGQAFSKNDSTFFAPSFEVRNASEGKFELWYRTGETEKVKIKLLNDKGQTLYQEWVRSKAGFVKPFDLSKLNSGTYTMQVLNGESVLSETITLQSATEQFAGLIELSEVANSKKFILDIDDTVATDLEMYIVNKDGEVLYNETTVSGTKVYNLSNIEMKEVSVLIYSKGQIVKSSDIKL